MNISEKTTERTNIQPAGQAVEQPVCPGTAQCPEHAFEPVFDQASEGSVEQRIEQTSGQRSGKYERTGQAMKELLETAARLRAPDGCPWDRAQDHLSLKAACVEEAAEVVSGINILTQTGRAHCLMEELGDLLFQVVMHAQIAEEEGIFTMEDVIRGINEKMIRRHPHVFGEESLKYPPEEYVKSLKSPSDARDGVNDSTPPYFHENVRECLSEPQKSLNGIVIDWKHIKSFEKAGREWEEDYLFEAFREAKELISVARKRKLEKKN